MCIFRALATGKVGKLIKKNYKGLDFFEVLKKIKLIKSIVLNFTNLILPQR